MTDRELLAICASIILAGQLASAGIGVLDEKERILPGPRRLVTIPRAVSLIRSRSQY